MSAQPPQGDADPYGSFATAHVVSDDEGRFVVPAIAEGGGLVQVEIDQDLPYRAKPQPFFVANPDPTRVEIRILPVVRVEGIVRAERTGQPVAGAVLFLDGKHITTDAQGKFAALVLPGDLYVELTRDPDGWRLSAVGADKTHPVSGGVANTYSVPEGVKQFDLPPLEVTRSPAGTKGPGP